MHTILISKEHREFVESQAPRLDIGGFSNLASNDLSKASRLDYQYTGLYGELAWYLYRYNSFNKLKDLLDFKFENCRKNNIGDSGFDDSITFNNKTRFIDVKTSHVSAVDKIKHLNLVIPKREYHDNMIYIGAFSVGKDRRNVDEVVIAGWCFNEEVKEKWKYDSNKFCVNVSKLHNLKSLDEILNERT